MEVKSLSLIFWNRMQIGYRFLVENKVFSLGGQQWVTSVYLHKPLFSSLASLSYNLNSSINLRGYRV
jgi:hypothetical protein